MDVMVVKWRSIDTCYVTPGKLKDVLKGLRKQYVTKKVIKRMNDEIDINAYPDNKVIVFAVGHTGKECTVTTNFYKWTH